MGCLFSYSEKEVANIHSAYNYKTIPLRRIHKLLHFKSIIPSEMNFEVTTTHDGQYFLTQDNKEVRFGFVHNYRRWSIAQLQSMNYPTFNDNYRVTIGIKEFETLESHEYILVPANEDIDIV